MKEIFSIIHDRPIVCPEHHIALYYNIVDGEMVLKCDWCDYTLVPLNELDELKNKSKELK